MVVFFIITRGKRQGVSDQKSVIRNQKPEIRNQKPVTRNQKPEICDQITLIFAINQLQYANSVSFRGHTQFFYWAKRRE